MKKVLYFVVVAALVFATASCDNIKKLKHHYSDDEDEEMVDDEDMDDEDEDEDEDSDENFIVGEEEDDEEVAIATADELNATLLGNWSNNADPTINMVLSDKKGNYDDHKGYGYIQTYNEFFEPEYTYVFTDVTADGEDIKVDFIKTQMECVGGDPDNYDSEEPAVWEERTVASGVFTVSPAGRNKCKLSSGDKKLNHLTLYK